VLDDKEAVQQLERQRRDGEEIERDDCLAVILKERTPSLGRVTAAVQATQVPRDSPDGVQHRLSHVQQKMLPNSKEPQDLT
jgi:hypothetical protein